MEQNSIYNRAAIMFCCLLYKLARLKLGMAIVSSTCREKQKYFCSSNAQPCFEY